MNFSNAKTLRKVLSLVIVLCMMATMFTGCFKKKPAVEPTDPPVSVETTPSTEAPTEPAPTEPVEINENMATVLAQLKVRGTPAESAPEVDVLEVGDKVEVIQTQTTLDVTWGYIAYNDGEKRGWVQMEFVEYDYKSNETDEPTNGGENTEKPDEIDTPKDNNEGSTGNGGTTVLYRGTVNVNELNIRKSPDQNSERVGGLKSGDKVEIYEKSGDWGRIKQGWIKLSYVKLDNSGSSQTPPPDVDGNGSTKVISRGVVYNTDNLNIRKGPSVDNEWIGALKGGDRVEVYEKSGSWGRIKQGWISLNYVYIDGTGTGNNKTGTVTASELRIRSGPGTGYDVVGSLENGEEVTILYHFTTGGQVWGNIKQGWICLDYVDVDGLDEDDDDDSGISWEDSENDKGESGGKVIDRGVVTADKLNVRKSASSEGTKVGTLNYGDWVEIYETSNGWARVKKGWISLEYIYLDGSGDGGDYGTITTDGVNVRRGPGKDHAVIGSLDEGDDVTILFEIKVGGLTWGDTGEGWVCMDYVELD